MTLPPHAQLLGLQEESSSDGSPGLLMPYTDAVIGRSGFPHGGTVTGLLDMAIVALQHALLQEGLTTRVKPIGVSGNVVSW